MGLPPLRCFSTAVINYSIGRSNSRSQHSAGMAEDSSKDQNPPQPPQESSGRGTVFLAKEDELANLEDEFGFITFPHPLRVLDYCETSDYRSAKAFAKGEFTTPMKDSERGKLKRKSKKYVKGCKKYTCLDAAKLRSESPDHVPVSVKRDLRSPVLVLEHTKYLVPGHLRLEELVDYIRLSSDYYGTMTVYFKNTQPSADTLISEIDVENKDKDGFLHMTFEIYPGDDDEDEFLHMTYCGEDQPMDPDQYQEERRMSNVHLAAYSGNEIDAGNRMTYDGENQLMDLDPYPNKKGE